jgi:hypothetical protein
MKYIEMGDVSAADGMGKIYFSAPNAAGSSLISYLCAGAGRTFLESFSRSLEYSAA